MNNYQRVRAILGNEIRRREDELAMLRRTFRNLNSVFPAEQKPAVRAVHTRKVWGALRYSQVLDALRTNGGTMNTPSIKQYLEQQFGHPVNGSALASMLTRQKNIGTIEGSREPGKLSYIWTIKGENN